MKRLLLAWMVFTCLNASAQNYLLTFAGTEASNTIDSILVQNLTQGTKLKLSGTDTLHLHGVLEVQNRLKNGNQSVLFYPNPMDQKGSFEFDAPQSGPATIEVFNAAGKQLIQAKLELGKGHQKFQLSNLDFGMNYIEISSSDYRLTGTILSQNKGKETPKLEDANGKAFYLNGARISTTTSMVKTMQYNDGEILLFKSYSGTYVSVSTVIPSSGILIPVVFFECTDADNNHYETVQIGTQIWMAENLKTTKYQGGADIPMVTNWADWGNLSSPGYCWYNNDIHYKDSIGGIYNWYTVGTGQLCPAGWRVPLNLDWATLSNYLGSPWEAGGKMKDVGTRRWKSPNLGASNQSGFTAIPGNYRHWDGVFPDLTNAGRQIIWWSSEDGGSAEWAGSVQLVNSSATFDNGTSMSKKKMGYYVRCLKN